MEPAETGQSRMRQCSGLSPEVVTLDLDGADEFSMVWQSLPRMTRKRGNVRLQ